MKPSFVCFKKWTDQQRWYETITRFPRCVLVQRVLLPQRGKIMFVCCNVNKQKIIVRQKDPKTLTIFINVCSAIICNVCTGSTLSIKCIIAELDLQGHCSAVYLYIWFFRAFLKSRLLINMKWSDIRGKETKKAETKSAVLSCYV